MAFTILKPSNIFCLLVLLLVLHFPISCKAGNILYSDDTLYTGESLRYGPKYRLVMQTDCNLVLYDNTQALWASDTENSGQNCRCTLKREGYLLIQDQDGTIIWRSNSGGTTAYYVLILQKDRNVVIYGPNVWSTKTSIENVWATVTNIRDVADNILYSGDTLKTGEALRYGPNYRLVMQTDCSLVLYDKQQALWVSDTKGSGQNCGCTLKREGYLVIRDKDGSIIWRSNDARTTAHYVLILRKDRNVVIYGPNVWATGTNVGSTWAANTSIRNVSDAAPVVAVVNNALGRKAKLTSPELLESIVGAVVN